jgi:hypothetical protein
MSHQMHVVKKRLVRLAIAGGLFTGAVGAPLLLAAGTAQAAPGPCGTAIAAGTVCTLTGTLTLTPGSLTLTSPTALAWSGTANGLDLHLEDVIPAQQSYVVDDATGTGAGWHVTASATTFTSVAAGASLPNANTLSTNGGTTYGANTAPTPVCSTGATCTLPANPLTYPVPITTGGAASTIYDDSTANGLGSIIVGGGASVVGWWLNVPANTVLVAPGTTTYLSTVTMQIISGP